MLVKTYTLSLINKTLLDRGWMADTLAMVILSTIFAGINEYFIVRLTFYQVVIAQLSAAPINIITARPYGVYRDFLMEKFAVHSNKWLNDLIVDTISFVSFQMPLYIIILKLSGATFVEILTGCTSALTLMFLLGRIYGVCLDVIRKYYDALVDYFRSYF